MTSRNRRFTAWIFVGSVLVWATPACGGNAANTDDSGSGGSLGDGDDDSGDGDGDAVGDGDGDVPSSGGASTTGGAGGGLSTGGSGGGIAGGKNCDYATVVTDEEPPGCDYGYVHEIIEGTYGDCVDITECGCESAGSQDQCGSGLDYVCYNTNRCGHLIH